VYHLVAFVVLVTVGDASAAVRNSAQAGLDALGKRTP